MAQLPEFKRVLREDLPDAEGEWVDRLLSPVNSFNEQVYSSLNNGLTLGDNVVGQIEVKTFKTSPTYISNKAFTPIEIDWKYKVPPRAVMIGAMRASDSDAIITNPLSLDWRLTGPGKISIRFIVGLKNGTKYDASFIVL